MTTPTFLWPVPGHYTLSGRFNDVRGYGLHSAIDIRASIGDPIVSVAAGRVAFAGRAGDCGLAVFIDHAGGWRSHYCHLSQLRVLAGEAVAQGQRIGDVGVSGVADGPHLHINLFAPTALPGSRYVAWVNKYAVDPLPYLHKEVPHDMVIILVCPGTKARWVLVDGVWKVHLSAAASAALDAAGPDTYRHATLTQKQIDAIPNLP